MTNGAEERLAAEAAMVDPHENEPTDMSKASRTSSAARERGGQVVALRISPALLERVRTVAAEKGVGPSTLMRQWVIERLESQEGDANELPEALDRLSHDLERVRQLTQA